MHLSLENLDVPSWDVTVQVQANPMHEPEYMDDLLEATISFSCSGEQPGLEDAERLLQHLKKLLD